MDQILFAVPVPGSTCSEQLDTASSKNRVGGLFSTERNRDPGTFLRRNSCNQLRWNIHRSAWWNLEVTVPVSSTTATWLCLCACVEAHTHTQILTLCLPICLSGQFPGLGLWVLSVSVAHCHKTENRLRFYWQSLIHSQMKTLSHPISGIVWLLTERPASVAERKLKHV